jgi:CTP synthase
LTHFKVISVRDVSSTYHVPLLLKEQGVLDFLMNRLKLDKILISQTQLEKGKTLLKQWIKLTEEYVSYRIIEAIMSIKHLIKLIYFRHDRFLQPVVIVLVGKYTNLQDSYLSVKKSLEHSGLNCERKIDLKVCKINFVFRNVCVINNNS